MKLLGQGPGGLEELEVFWEESDRKGLQSYLLPSDSYVVSLDTRSTVILKSSSSHQGCDEWPGTDSVVDPGVDYRPTIVDG